MRIVSKLLLIIGLVSVAVLVRAPDQLAGFPPSTIENSPSPATETTNQFSVVKFTQIALGVDHACGILESDQSVECWGRSDYGKTQPPVDSFKSLSASHHMTCGITTENTTLCWGRNADQFEINDVYTSVSVGERSACGIKPNQTVTCWSIDGVTIGVKTQIHPAERFTQIELGSQHACGITTDSRIVCWGRNDYGQATPPGGEFLQLSSGAGHSCAVRIDEKVVCWGVDWHGRLDAPAGSFQYVSTTWDHACGLLVDGSIVCWGNNHIGESEPPSGTFTAMEVGGHFGCALTEDGEVQCWGNDAHGRTRQPMFVSPAFPDAPANVDVVEASNAGEVIINWRPVRNAEYYRIGWISSSDYRALTDQGQDWQDGFRFVEVANNGQGTHVITDLKPNDRYVFAVGSLQYRFSQANWSRFKEVTLSATEDCLK